MASDEFKEMVEHFDKVADIWSFNVKYNNTEANQNVHRAFIDFCWQETDGNYLQGIKKLLENYADDYRYSTLSSEIEAIKSSVISLSNTGREKEDDKDDEMEAF